MPTTAAAFVATMISVALVCGLDSAASLSISHTMFIVVTSNVLATLGLHGLYTPITANRIRIDPRTASALLLVAGVALITPDRMQLSPLVMLGVVGITTAVVTAMTLE